MLNKSLSILTVFLVLGYLIYSLAFLMPFSYSYFSLIDDGQSLLNTTQFVSCLSSGMDCNQVGEFLIEGQSGRFRPGYWLLQVLQNLVLGENPVFHHGYRILIVGSILVAILSKLVLQAKGNLIGTLVAASLFFTSYSFSENFIRLGPAEPYQILVLSIISFLFLARSFKYILPLLILAISIKETSAVLALPILVVELLNSSPGRAKRIFFLVLIPLIFTSLAIIVSRPQANSFDYSDFYNLSFGHLLTNFRIYAQALANITSPFLKVVPIAVVVALLSQKSRSILLSRHTLFWFITFLTTFFIIIPWEYVLERYLLLTLFSFSIFLGILLSAVVESLKSIKNNLIIDVIAIIAISNLFFKGFPLNFAKTLNYSNWYSNFLQFEYDQTLAISKSEGEVYVNANDSLDNWEVLYELPIHLSLIHKSDVKVKRVGSVDEIKSGFLFTRIPFGLSINLEELVRYELVESRSYKIDQIDPLVFREMFNFRPLQTVLNPPYLIEPINYYWEIRKI